jgi:hypothetical protein
VLVPNNDFDEEKTILRKFTTDKNAAPISYVSPLAKIVRMDPLYELSAEKGIIANDSENKSIEVGTIEIPSEISTINFDTLCVSADFLSLLQDYDMRQGNYGLVITLFTAPPEEGGAPGEHHLLFDNLKDMFGNVYGFTSYFH